MMGVGRDLKYPLVATCSPASPRIIQGRGGGEKPESLDFFFLSSGTNSTIPNEHTSFST